MKVAAGKEGPRARAWVGAPAFALPPGLALVALLPVLALGALAGCGGSSSGSSDASVPASPAAAAATASVSAVDAVATVAGVPIAKSSYEHWLEVEQKLDTAGSPSHQALGFLITSEWVLGEASARHTTVSEAEVKRRFAQLVHQSFPKSGSLSGYLAKSGETEADLLSRIKVELLAAHIADHIAAGKAPSERSAMLAGFERNFQAHWKRLTSCDPGYVMEDCKQYTGKPENLAAVAAAHNRASGGGASGSSSGAASANGEVYTAPGAFSIMSSEFTRNGHIPTEFTCAGKGVSPPLSWQKVPAKAAELFLFVIDDNSAGIRWVVGNIDPSSKGVAAGQTPPGGIVGTNTAGQVAYSPICPARGKSAMIEFVMYALKKKIPLTRGFSPTTAEADYGQHRLILGQAAVTYGIASR